MIGVRLSFCNILQTNPVICVLCSSLQRGQVDFLIPSQTAWRSVSLQEYLNVFWFLNAELCHLLREQIEIRVDGNLCPNAPLKSQPILFLIVQQDLTVLLVGICWQWKSSVLLSCCGHFSSLNHWEVFVFFVSGGSVFQFVLLNTFFSR